MASVRVLYFAVLRDVAKVDEERVEASTTNGVFDAAVKLHPDLEPYRAATRIARNARFVEGDEAIDEDDEIALLPPVSGG